jgi:hypothetical protein
MTVAGAAARVGADRRGNPSLCPLGRAKDDGAQRYQSADDLQGVGRAWRFAGCMSTSVSEDELRIDL